MRIGQWSGAKGHALQVLPWKDGKGFQRDKKSCGSGCEQADQVSLAVFQRPAIDLISGIALRFRSRVGVNLQLVFICALLIKVVNN